MACPGVPTGRVPSTHAEGQQAVRISGEGSARVSGRLWPVREGAEMTEGGGVRRKYVGTVCDLEGPN